ncbi:uncharacterized protein FIESC28_09950 [Fusarium coffeatum]|uniref:Peptidase A1 domain-containing protein n=1 Tax=Fusarium coffeatum TaxID=231269 RepID=A0A366QX88_9HYPO|nr:uncharacterized protein FIESC28_09950 [Fusarium coffeatum]RBR09342.1 hypothetical protein FIESC28_09950 [Fusarium coffeatum]
MKGSSTFLLASSTLLSAASGLQLHKRDNPAVVPVDFERQIRDASESLKRRADDKTTEMKVDKHGLTWLYWANFTIGTPPQRLYSEIDTGSADLLVLTDEIEACTGKEAQCTGNVFSTGKSRTFDWLDSESQASGSFGSGETWSGYYGTDTFTLGDATIDNFQFIATTEFKATGSGIFSIFGIGLAGLELAEKKYANLPYALAEAGEINTPAYSLWLDSDQKGQFLFGGVNKAKYKGPLVSFPIPKNNQNGKTDRLLVVMEGFGVSSNGKYSGMDFTPRPVLLDSGSVRSQLNAEMLMHIVETFDDIGFVATPSGGQVPCNVSEKYTVDFTFGELTFKIPLKDFIIRPTQDYGLDGVPYCSLNFNPDATLLLLGDDFLRATYLVYDYETMEISMAQYNPDGGKDDIHEIVKNVPGAEKLKDVPMKFDVWDGTAFGDPTTAPTYVTAATMTLLNGGTATEATVTGDPRETNAGLKVAKPTETGESKDKKDDEDNAATRSLPGSAMAVVVMGVIARAMFMW